MTADDLDAADVADLAHDEEANARRESARGERRTEDEDPLFAWRSP